MSRVRPTDQYVTVGSTSVRYWQIGDKGSTVILLHGIIRFIEDWLPNIGALSQNHRVYAVDLAGYGRSDKPDGAYSLDYLIDFVKAFINEMGIERTHLIGHSLGGGIVLGLAHRYPELIDRLVLVANVGFGRKIHWSFRLTSLPRIGEILFRPNRLLIECALKAVVYDSTVITREKVEESYQMIKLPGAQASFLRTVRAGVTWRGLHPDLLNATWETLPSITKPTLIVWGRQDPVLPVAQAYVGGEQIPDTRLYLFDRCGHFPQLEYPTAFNRLVETFLSAGLPSQADRFAPMVIDQTNRQTSL